MICDVNNSRRLYGFADLSQETGIHPNDIISTLQYLGMLKYFKGEYFVVKKTVSFTLS